MNNKKNKNNSIHVSMTNSTVIATVPELPSTSSNMPFYNSNTNYYYPTNTHYVPMNSSTTTDLSLPPLSQLLPLSNQQLTRQETHTTDILTSDQQPDVMTIKNEQQVSHSYLQQGKHDTINSSREGHQALHIPASSHHLFKSKNRIYVYPPRAPVYSSSVPYTASSHMSVRRGYMPTQQQRNSYYVLPAQQQQTGILLQPQYGVVSSHHNNNVMMPSLSSSSTSSSSSSSAADVNLFHPSNTGLIYSRNHTHPCYPLPSPPPSLGDITVGDPNQLMITETGTTTTTYVNTNSGRKIYSFVPLPGLNQKKRPRRKFHEVERLYHCNYQNCTKAYGTLNHLNAHVSMQRHGSKRQPSEFKELRKMWRKQKRDHKQQEDENYDPSSESSQQEIHPSVTSVNLNQPLLVTSSSSDQHYPLQPTLLSHANPYQPPPPQAGHWDHLTTTEFMRHEY